MNCVIRYNTGSGRHDAGDEVEQDDEREEDHEALENSRRERRHTSVVDGDRAERRRDDERDRRIQRCTPKANPRVDEKRGHPHEQDKRDRDPVELQTEREIDRQRVPTDRDEQHDRDDEAEQRRATQGSTDATRRGPTGR